MLGPVNDVYRGLAAPRAEVIIYAAVLVECDVTLAADAAPGVALAYSGSMIERPYVFGPEAEVVYT